MSGGIAGGLKFPEAEHHATLILIDDAQPEITSMMAAMKMKKTMGMDVSRLEPENHCPQIYVTIA